MSIKRYFTPTTINRIKKDFNLLLQFIKKTNGEFDFSIRENSFNIYFKGNSLAQITPKEKNLYKISIHSKFFDDTKADDKKYYKYKKNSDNIILEDEHLHPFFQSKHMLEFASKIKKVNNGEEITFEQTLITDNLNRSDLIIIDRQVTDSTLKGKRMDLLVLKQIKENEYNFMILEVKLGNNNELKSKVVNQLDYYINHINQYFNDYKSCYELQYEQKVELGILENMPFKKIKIVKPVEGMVVVGGYSGIAKKNIDLLKKQYPSLEVKHFENKF